MKISERRRPVGTALVGTLLILGLLGGAHAQGAQRTRIDLESECDGANVPRYASVTGVSDDGGAIGLEVLVLMDGVPKRDAVASFDVVRSYYAPLKIEVNAVFRRASFPADGTNDAGDKDTIRDLDLIDLSRALVGGERPDGIDAVFTLTTKELYSTGFGYDEATAGRVACVGGIEFPDEAFAIGEHFDEATHAWTYGPFIFQRHYSAKIAAHELGHLLGAHHEYANCAEGSDDDPFDDVNGVCTVMINDVGLLGSRFSTFESAVIRGYALEFATP